MSKVEELKLRIDTPPANILTMNTGTSEPTVIFHADGNVSWKGRVIESDGEFKAAMIELLGYMRQSFGYKPKDGRDGD